MLLPNHVSLQLKELVAICEAGPRNMAADLMSRVIILAKFSGHLQEVQYLQWVWGPVTFHLRAVVYIS